MATKKCPNGHQYDSSIYGDQCPFCPSTPTGTHVNTASTRVNSPMGGTPTNESPTIPIQAEQNAGGGRTVIRSVNGTSIGPSDGGRKLVGLLVSYDQSPLGEVYKIYEGRNIIGRGNTCDIPITNDSHISTEHLLILYRNGDNIFWADDMNSSNGSYINGTFVSEKMKIHTNDIIVIGASKFVFLAIPQL